MKKVVVQRVKRKPREIICLVCGHCPRGELLVTGPEEPDKRCNKKHKLNFGHKFVCDDFVREAAICAKGVIENA
ncbi:MAG: hypothetical protein LBN00_06390 [Oscillospiraceae bacterium]|jgi:hypothetical protein|nr:hypothetical protein [Oscillospiraceae bacterium]